MNKETQDKLDKLEKDFLEIKQLLKDKPDAEMFPYRIMKAIKICNEYENIQNENTQQTSYSFLDGKGQKVEYKENQLIISLYEEIGDIQNFDFLKNHHYREVAIYNFFNKIQIETYEKIGTNAIATNYIHLFDRDLIDNIDFFNKLYEVYLEKDISLMYQLQNSIQREYWYHTNCKNYEDFKKKYKTITKIAKQSKILAKGYGKTSMYCFGAAFFWFLLCWSAPIFFDLLRYVCDLQYNLSQDYFGEIFTFLSNLLFKLPSFVLCLVGVKFLYLFVQYKTEEREFSMLDSYLEKLPQDCTKERAELIKQLAPHFFPDKKATKISQSFLQELLRKALEK